MNILIVTSSASDASTSTQLALYARDQITARHADAQVEHLDLVQSLPVLIDANVLKGMFGSEDHAAHVQSSNAAVDQLLRADVVIVAAPMYNFGVPAVLKGWIDQVARAGKTFRYTEKGPEGLLRAKALAIVSSGGAYEQLPAMDHALPHLQTVLAFLGLEVQGVRVEGLAMTKEPASLVHAGKERIDTALRALNL